MTTKTKIPVKREKLTDKQLCAVVTKKSHVKDVRVISPVEVETAAWVRLKCRYGCDGFGQCLIYQKNYC